MAPHNVLVTGPYGEAGEAILDRLVGKDQYEFTFLNRSDHPEYKTRVADIADYEAIRPAFDGQDAVIRLATLLLTVTYSLVSVAFSIGPQSLPGSAIGIPIEIEIIS